jgi:hypothetical protein
MKIYEKQKIFSSSIPGLESGAHLAAERTGT